MILTDTELRKEYKPYLSRLGAFHSSALLRKDLILKRQNFHLRTHLDVPSAFSHEVCPEVVLVLLSIGEPKQLTVAKASQGFSRLMIWITDTRRLINTWKVAPSAWLHITETNAIDHQAVPALLSEWGTSLEHNTTKRNEE